MDYFLTDNLPVICDTASNRYSLHKTKIQQINKQVPQFHTNVNAGCTHMNSTKYFNFVVNLS
jgi:hypothetical protein